MNDAAPEEGAAAEEKKPFLRRPRRPPTALLVTLLGIALTAWLLPALTRQWNDRQSAHTVQAGVVSDMTAATARVFQGGDALWNSIPNCYGDVLKRVVNGPQNSFASPKLKNWQRQLRCFRRAGREIRKASAKIDPPWSLASAEIEARMRAYLNPQVVAAWQLFSWLIVVYDGSFGVRTGVSNGHPYWGAPALRGYLELQEAAHGGFDLQAAAAREVGTVLRDAKYGPIYRIAVSDVDRPVLGRLRAKLRSYGAYSGGAIADLKPHALFVPIIARFPLFLSFNDNEIDLSSFEQEIAQEVLNSHVTGYSTTTHDLIHDLIP